MSPFSLKFDPWAGSDISDCAIEAKRLAAFLEITVCFDFNNVHCMMKSSGTPSEMVRQYHKVVGLKISYKIITGNP